MNQLNIFTAPPPVIVTAKTKPTQTEILYKYLKSGGRISDHQSFNILGFPNLRSRVCNVEKEFGVTVKRYRPEGKRYLIYYL